MVGRAMASTYGSMAQAWWSMSAIDSPETICATSALPLIPVPDSPYRHDPLRLGGGCLDLLPQPSHMDGHSGLVAEVPAPHLLQQLLPGERFARVGHQEHQQIELPSGQRQLRAPQGCLVRGHIQRQL